MKKKGLILFLLIPRILFGQDIKEFFTKSAIVGSITIYDYQKGDWIFSDSTKSEIGTLPASTFKIVNTLIGLEEKLIKGKNDTLKWDGKPKYFKSFKIPNWNKDNDLEMAFKNSTIWYYENISKQLKKRKYRKHLRKNQYSNRKIRNGRGDDFWNYGELKVSPIEQIKLLLKLYKNELTFLPQHQKLVKELMIEKETSEFILRTKTGWCYDRKDVGWYIGYIEKVDNVIFFATRIEKELEEKKRGFSKLRKSITNEIINELYSIKIN